MATMWRVGSPCPCPRGTQQKTDESAICTASLRSLVRSVLSSANPGVPGRPGVPGTPGLASWRAKSLVRASLWPPWPPNQSSCARDAWRRRCAAPNWAENGELSFIRSHEGWSAWEPPWRSSSSCGSATSLPRWK